MSSKRYQFLHFFIFFFFMVIQQIHNKPPSHLVMNAPLNYASYMKIESSNIKRNMKPNKEKNNKHMSIQLNICFLLLLLLLLL